MMQRLCRFLDGQTGQDGQDIDIGRHLLSVGRGPFWRPWSLLRSTTSVSSQLSSTCRMGGGRWRLILSCRHVLVSKLH